MSHELPPLVTFFVFAYNQEDVVEEAIEGALSQTYPNLEIILSDDCSQDRTHQLMKEAAHTYRGSHEVIVNRNPNNLGLVGHVNRAFQLAAGSLIVFAGGDDVSLPNRTQLISKVFFGRTPQPMLVESGATTFSADRVGTYRPPIALRHGVGQNSLILENNFYLGPTVAISKSLYDIFGPVRTNSCPEDTAWGFRAAAFGGIISIDVPLVRYRLGMGITTKYAGRNLSFWEFLDQRRQHLEFSLGSQTEHLHDLNHIEEAGLAVGFEVQSVRKVIRDRLTVTKRAIEKEDSVWPKAHGGSLAALVGAVASHPLAVLRDLYTWSSSVFFYGASRLRHRRREVSRTHFMDAE